MHSITIVAHHQNLTTDLCEWHQACQALLESVSHTWAGCLSFVWLGDGITAEVSFMKLCSWLGLPWVETPHEGISPSSEIHTHAGHFNQNGNVQTNCSKISWKERVLSLKNKASLCF
jgi:hypothetical protein